MSGQGLYSYTFLNCSDYRNDASRYFSPSEPKVIPRNLHGYFFSGISAYALAPSSWQ